MTSTCERVTGTATERAIHTVEPVRRGPIRAHHDNPLVPDIYDVLCGWPVWWSVASAGGVSSVRVCERCLQWAVSRAAPNPADQVTVQRLR